MAKVLGGIVVARTNEGHVPLPVKTTGANPGPLGLFGFALTTALLQGGVTTITEGSTRFLVYGMALGFGGCAQALAGIFEFCRGGTTLAAVAFVCYGAFWIGTAVNGMAAAAGIFPPPAHEGEQMLLALWGILTFFFFCASLTVNLCLQALFLLLSVVFWLLAGGVFNPACSKAGGWIGLVVAGIAFYGGCAEMLNEAYGKTVLPLGRCNPGAFLLPYFQRAVGAIPVLGGIYLRAVEKEDKFVAAAAGQGEHQRRDPTHPSVEPRVKALPLQATSV